MSCPSNGRGAAWRIFAPPATDMSVRSAQRPSWFVWLHLGGAVLLTAGFLLGLGLQHTRGSLVDLVDDERVSPNALGVGRVEGILRYIEAKYVDPVDRDALVDAAVAAILRELDPYSGYVGPEEVPAHRARLMGTAEGTGVELGLLRDSLVVLRVLPGSPAASAGLRDGDRLTSIAGDAVGGQGYDLSELEALLGTLPPGPITVSVLRPGVGPLPPVTLARQMLALPTVSAGLVLEGDIGYVAVSQFGDSTYFSFMAELERLVTEEDVRHLILDLRGNGGGYLREAVRLLGQFFPESGHLLAYTEGERLPRREFKASGRVLFPVERVAVLVDERSASASEVVAGALQDWDRAAIVGRPTYGKGMVQESFELKDGGLLHLSVARYHTPSGRTLQRPYPGGDERRPGRAPDARPAFATASGREVLGAGGIDPDVVVDIAGADTVWRSAAWRALARRRGGDARADAGFGSSGDRLAAEAPRWPEGLRDSLAAVLNDPEWPAVLADPDVRAAVWAIRGER